MAEFLKLHLPTDALDLFFRHLPPVQVQAELLPTYAALGRVLASDVLAEEALPAFARSSVDGYAVRAADTFGASDSLPAYLSVVGEVPMGAAPGFVLQRGQAALIHTGGMLPQGADAVVMLEYTQAARADEVEVLRAAGVGENVLQVGEDVRPGDCVLKAGTLLRAAQIGGLLALGKLEVAVALRPQFGILSTGDEVVPVTQKPAPGQVRDINTGALTALIEQFGGVAKHYPIVPDRAEALEAALRQARAENDAVIITAGSSASVRDLTADVIQQMGAPGVLVHGVNIRPGKPTILAVCDGQPIIGLPGNPVSALVIARLFVAPLVQRLLGMAAQPWPLRVARLTLNIPSQAGREDYVPVRLLGNEAEPIFFKSNLIFTLAQADGLVRIPADATGLEAGTIVDVFLI
ncbi:MAG: molybdopterin molybdotransferase MoeA [Longilinea sp.]|nr:molybdopterin molybdotransferase MoeA [Longilinea sp.]